jgi:hypothetical protein
MGQLIWYHLLAYAHDPKFIFLAGPFGLISKSKMSMGIPIVVQALGIYVASQHIANERTGRTLHQQFQQCGLGLAHS